MRSIRVRFIFFVSSYDNLTDKEHYLEANFHYLEAGDSLYSLPPGTYLGPFFLGPFLSLDVRTTYEEIIHTLIQRHFLRPLDPSLRYDMFRIAYQRNPSFLQSNTIGTGIRGWREGQSFPSTGPPPSARVEFFACVISIEMQTLSLSKQKLSSTSPSLGETISAILSSSEVGIINLAASVVTITTALILIEKWWSKKHAIDSTSSQGRSSGSEEIVAIRLLMNHGPEQKIPSEWITDPERLKHWIDVLNNPSGVVKPLLAIFERRNGTKVYVDVSEGAQNNMQPDELLSHLNIGATEE